MVDIEIFDLKGKKFGKFGAAFLPGQVLEGKYDFSFGSITFNLYYFLYIYIYHRLLSPGTVKVNLTSSKYINGEH